MLITYRTCGLLFSAILRSISFGGRDALREFVMDPLTAAAASGMRSRLESLDLVANNLANAGTDAFKAEREFYGLFRSVPGVAETDAAIGEMPVIERSWIDFSRGTLRHTGEPTHLALGSDAFFGVQGPTSTLYTRTGRLQVSASGQLTTVDGYPLLFVDAQSVKLEAGKPFEVSGQGTVTQNGAPVGRLKLVEFKDLTKLAKQGRTYYRAPETAGATPAVDPRVQQGRLEESNVTPAESAVRLVSVMRQFEMLQRAVSIGADMNRRSIEEVARVNG
jgi:flagellar basal body rod protein FlgG